jgi:hypothetical protein
LRVHRACKDRALRHRSLHLPTRAEKFSRLGEEALAAAGRTEVIGVTAVVGAMFRGVWIDIHAADRVFDSAGRRLGRRDVIVVVGMVVHWRFSTAFDVSPKV